MNDAGHRAVVWFRRDLRLHDHPALVDAQARHEWIVPLYVLDERLLHGRFASANRTWYLLGSLRALDAGLRERGSRLHLRIGDPRLLVPRIAGEIGASAVYVSRDHAPFGRARDRAVAQGLRERGIAFHAKRGNYVHEPEDILNGEGAPFSVYSPFRRVWDVLPRRAVLPAPARIESPSQGEIEAGAVPTLSEVGLGAGPTARTALLPEPGETAARERLNSWLRRGIAGYHRTRDRLDDPDGTSRLSADLHLGTLSALEVVERVLGAARDDGAEHGQRTFLGELAWREFYGHVLFHRPSMRQESFRPDFDALERATDEPSLAAWREGRTGYPVVDAAMRQLTASGWMHNRGRMLTASFLTKHLLLDWRAGEAHFMANLIDGDIASNNGGWQWSASTGTDPQPYFRIFNPTLQGRRFDPEGDYVRHWVPELRAVPTSMIHTPWQLTAEAQSLAGCRIGIDYPAPIVEHREGRARALAAYGAARAGTPSTARPQRSESRG